MPLYLCVPSALNMFWALGSIRLVRRGRSLAGAEFMSPMTMTLAEGEVVRTESIRDWRTDLAIARFHAVSEVPPNCEGRWQTNK